MFLVIGDNFNHANAISRLAWESLFCCFSGQLCHRLLIFGKDNFVTGGQLMYKLFKLSLSFFNRDGYRHSFLLICLRNV